MCNIRVDGIFAVIHPRNNPSKLLLNINKAICYKFKGFILKSQHTETDFFRNNFEKIHLRKLIINEINQL